MYHCVKSVRIRGYSGPYFPAFGLNMDQNNSEYGHFLCNEQQAGGFLCGVLTIRNFYCSLRNEID